MRRYRHLYLIVVLAAGCCIAQAKQMAVVTDPLNPAADLTTVELVKIFNAHTQSWPDGRPIRIVLRRPSSAEMHMVVRKLFAMTPEQAESFIQSHTRSIVIADSDDAVVKLVSNTRGAIGVVDLFSITNDVKVMKVDGKLPVEQGYVLRGN